MASFILLHGRRDIYFFDNTQEPMGGNMSKVFKGYRLSDIKIGFNNGSLNWSAPEVIKLSPDGHQKISSLSQLAKQFNASKIQKELEFIVSKQLTRPVAIKVLLKDLATNPMYRERFERESQISIEHKNVIRNLDYVQVKTNTGDKHHIIMEYLEGMTLHDWLYKTNRKFTEPEALSITKQLLSGLDAIHSQGLIHRDIKGANIMLDSNAQIKIMDFGIAKHEIGNQSNLTGIATFIGTISYAAPEQIRLQNYAVGAWTDLWAVGVLLYELLTVKLPFEGENDDDTKRRILEEDPRPVTGISPSIARIIEKATQKEHKKRYTNATDFEIDIVKILGGGHIEGENSNTDKPPINPWLIISLVLSVIIIIIFILLII